MNAPEDTVLIGQALARARLLTESMLGKQRPDLDGDGAFVAALCWRLLELTAATAQVSADLQGRFPDLPWRELLGLRRRLIHGPLSLDREVLWLVLTQDVPVLIRGLDTILAAKPPSKPGIADSTAIRPA